MARILISESSPELGQRWRDALARQGHTVKLALDGRAAVSACQQTCYEIVITDMSLPDVNGVLLSGQISTILPNVSIIGLSSELTSEMVADEFGGDIPFVDRFFGKPVTPKALAAAVNELAAA
jgi:DNA-binding response OmpR family regulator